MSTKPYTCQPGLTGDSLRLEWPRFHVGAFLRRGPGSRISESWYVGELPIIPPHLVVGLRWLILSLHRKSGLWNLELSKLGILNKLLDWWQVNCHIRNMVTMSFTMIPNMAKSSPCLYFWIFEYIDAWNWRFQVKSSFKSSQVYCHIKSISNVTQYDNEGYRSRSLYGPLYTCIETDINMINKSSR